MMHSDRDRRRGWERRGDERGRDRYGDRPAKRARREGDRGVGGETVDGGGDGRSGGGGRREMEVEGARWPSRGGRGREGGKVVEGDHAEHLQMSQIQQDG